MLLKCEGFSLKYLLYLLQFLMFCEQRFLKVEAIRGENVVNVTGEEFPFVCSIGMKIFKDARELNHVCGGTLISTKHVLTAAHCNTNITKTDLQVICGSSNLRSKDAKIYGIMGWLTYEMWVKQNKKNPGHPTNDIAVYMIDTKNSAIKPVTLSSANRRTLKKSDLSMVGWGLTNCDELPTVMRKVHLKLLSREDCEKKMKKIACNAWKFVGNDEILCTFSEPPSIGCFGDSGNPVLDMNKQLVGVFLGITSQPGQNPTEITTDRVNLNLMVDYFREFINDVLSRDHLMIGVTNSTRTSRAN